jgi:hypothetical protein
MTAPQDPAGKIAEIELKARYDFLMVMYRAMWDNINRHVTVLWQAAGVLGTAFGAALLLKRDTTASEPNYVFDVATALVIAAAYWLVAHGFDSANWFNRNIQIIGNIEKIFFAKMRQGDWVHPYGDPQWNRKNKVLLHMRIQATLGGIVGVSAFLLHFVSRAFPTLRFPGMPDLVVALPTIVLVLGAYVCLKVFRETKGEQDEFMTIMARYQAAASSDSVKERIASESKSD